MKRIQLFVIAVIVDVSSHIRIAYFPCQKTADFFPSQKAGTVFAVCYLMPRARYTFLQTSRVRPERLACLGIMIVQFRDLCTISKYGTEGLRRVHHCDERHEALVQSVMNLQWYPQPHLGDKCETCEVSPHLL